MAIRHPRGAGSPHGRGRWNGVCGPGRGAGRGERRRTVFTHPTCPLLLPSAVPPLHRVWQVGGRPESIRWRIRPLVMRPLRLCFLLHGILRPTATGGILLPLKRFGRLSSGFIASFPLVGRFFCRIGVLPRHHGRALWWWSGKGRIRTGAGGTATRARPTPLPWIRTKSKRNRKCHPLRVPIFVAAQEKKKKE